MLWLFQIYNLLSFPPDAKNYSSKLHFNPHTSYLWLRYFEIYELGTLKSLYKIDLSLEPEESNVEFHAKVPTLARWPYIVLTFFNFSVSQICTSPEFVPTLSKESF